MRAATIERSAARMSEYDTRTARCSTARANAFENASSGSPASLRIGLIADQRTAALPSLQRRPGERISWPSVRDRLKPFPAAAGPLHSFGSRVHRYTHAAFGLARSCSPGIVDHSAQPHDQSELIFISFATKRADRACHLTVSNHGLAASPSRPPVPFVVWKPRKRPSFETGMPIFVKSRMPLRNDWRSVRLP